MSLGFFTLLHRLASVRNRRCHILRLVKRQQQQQHLLQQQQQLLQQQQRRRSSKRRDSSSTDSSDDAVTSATTHRRRHLVLNRTLVAFLTALLLLLLCFGVKTAIKNKDWMSRATLFRLLVIYITLISKMLIMLSSVAHESLPSDCLITEIMENVLGIWQCDHIGLILGLSNRLFGQKLIVLDGQVSKISIA